MLNLIGIGVRRLSSGAAGSLGPSQQRAWPFPDETLAVKVSALLVCSSACLILRAYRSRLGGRFFLVGVTSGSDREKP